MKAWRDTEDMRMRYWPAAIIIAGAIAVAVFY